MSVEQTLTYLVSEVQDVQRWQWVGYIGDGASFIGLIISVIVLSIATDVKTFFYRSTRIPKLRDGIRDSRARIGACLKDPASNEAELREHLSVCYSNLKSLKGKVQRGVRKEIRKTSALIETAQGGSGISNVEVNKIYHRLVVIETDVSNWLGDLGGGGLL